MEVTNDKVDGMDKAVAKEDVVEMPNVEEDGMEKDGMEVSIEKVDVVRVVGVKVHIWRWMV